MLRVYPGFTLWIYIQITNTDDGDAGRMSSLLAQKTNSISAGHVLKMRLESYRGVLLI